MNPDERSPWVLCPECAGVWFTIAATLEHDENGPKVGAYLSGNETQDAIICRECGYAFNVMQDA